MEDNMMTLKRQVALALVAGSVVSFASIASAEDVFQGQDVVHDARGNVVTSTSGYCVHTKWTSGNSECGTPARAPVAPAPRAPEPRIYK